MRLRRLQLESGAHNGFLSGIGSCLDKKQLADRSILILLRQANAGEDLRTDSFQSADQLWQLVLVTVDFDDSFGEGFRSFLGQVVPHPARDGPVCIFAREFLGVGTGVRIWCSIGPL